MKKHTFLLIACLLQFVPPCMAYGLKVISWNIRYDSGIDKENNWANRKTYLGKYIKKENPDIICLQEVLGQQKKFLDSYFYKYDCVGVGRNDGKTIGEYAQILFKKKQFELIASGWFWLSEAPDVAGSVGWDAQQTRIVTWVKLRKKNSRNTLIVLNTHFDHVGHKARIHSAELINSWIASKAGTEEIIVTGDFNDTEDSDMYKTLLKGSRLIDSFYSAEVKKGVEYTFHGFGMTPQEKRAKIDFVFTSNSIVVKKIIIPKEDKSYGCYLSDHCPIICKFKLNNR